MAINNAKRISLNYEAWANYITFGKLANKKLLPFNKDGLCFF